MSQTIFHLTLDFSLFPYCQFSKLYFRFRAQISYWSVCLFGYCPVLVAGQAHDYLFSTTYSVSKVHISFYLNLLTQLHFWRLNYPSRKITSLKTIHHFFWFDFGPSGFLWFCLITLKGKVPSDRTEYFRLLFCQDFRLSICLLSKCLLPFLQKSWVVTGEHLLLSSTKSFPFSNQQFTF